MEKYFLLYLYINLLPFFLSLNDSRLCLPVSYIIVSLVFSDSFTHKQKITCMPSSPNTLSVSYISWWTQINSVPTRFPAVLLHELECVQRIVGDWRTRRRIVGDWRTRRTHLMHPSKWSELKTQNEVCLQKILQTETAFRGAWWRGSRDMQPY